MIGESDMSYSLDAISDNCYSDSTVLINKLDIRDEALLNEVEVTLVSAKTALWENSPIYDTFDFAHYKAIHRFLFEDLYEWAGQVRTVNISKKGTSFCPFEEIEDQANRIFTRLHDHERFINLERGEFLSEIVDFYCVTNQLHPYREGNGRTQRLFITQLIHNAGYEDFDFANVDGDLLMIATIQSANSVTDLLRKLFAELVP